MATFESTGWKKAVVFHPTAPLQLMQHTEAATGTPSEGWSDTDANILKMFRVPRGAKIIDGGAVFGDGDTGAALEMNIKLTDGTTTKTYVSASAAAQAGGLVRFSGTDIGYKTTNDDFYFYVEVETAAGTHQDHATFLWVTYTQEEGY